jgi:DNA helicase-2/ATP-dependent DNA helicase PcrA
LELNKEQRRAVTEARGPSLVLAGAGSGKTMVIVERLAHLIGEQGVDPRRILALTFTNKAAAEMRERVAVRIGRGRVGAWLGTFHSFGLHVLRRDMDRLGRDANFTVFDETDQLSLIKKIAGDLDPRMGRVAPRAAQNWISQRKQVMPHERGPAEPGEEAYEQIWQAYHQALERAGGVDFDDLLLLTARLLDEHPDVRERWQYRYQYVHVDEYQDTNRVQYCIAQRLSETHGNLFVVGDEDQGIYSWRGATIQNILDFERDFPEASVFRLEENYRSTAPILAAANALVAHNTQRLGKTLWTSRKGGAPVRFMHADDGREEARFVAETIVEGGPERYAATAVLFRTNSQSREIEEALLEWGIPYAVIGGVRFYGRKEIKDLLAYLRLLVNPNDDVSLRRIVNVPRRGIGQTTLNQIEEYAARRGASLFYTMREIEHDQTFSSRARDSVGSFVHLIDELALQARNSEAVQPVVQAILERTDYREYVREADAEDSRARLENVDEFLSTCAERDEAEAKGLEAFLQDLALVTDADSWDSSAQAVALMTCHSAKGLEFDRVFLVGLEEGLLPHATSLESEEELEEERRLCYVAMTRARKELFLSAARERLLYGERMSRETSRFLDEIPRELLTPAGPENAPAEPPQMAPRSRTAAATTRKKKPPAAPAGEAESGPMTTGTRVRHARFGDGTVLYTSGQGARMKARIRFDTGRARDFMVAKTPLEVLDG